MNNEESKTRLRQFWIVAGVATIIGLIFTAQAYLAQDGSETFKWKEQLVRTMSGWYLWALFFPFILALARKFRFGRGSRLKCLLIHIALGAAIILIHAVVQALITDWLLHTGSEWHPVRNILSSGFVPLSLGRSLNYFAILTICMALDFYWGARDTEIQSARIENSILRAQIESLKFQIDPDFLFNSLDRLSRWIHQDLDEADSMITRLGDYLRMTLDNAVILEKPGDVEKIPFDPTFDEVNEIHIDSNDSATPVRKWLIITGIFTFLSFYYLIQTMIIQAGKGTTVNWPQFLLNCSGWYIWALITPLVLKFSSRYPVERRDLRKLLLTHLAGFISAWFFANLAYGAVKWASNLGQIGYLDQLGLSNTFGLDIICYSTIVAIESAVRYHRRYETGKLRTVRLNAQLARARLQALKMQLHPHFLFNALNSLSQLMREDTTAAGEMIVNLEKFLRLTFHSNNAHEIPLKDELEFLKYYLAIENVRFQDRLNIKMEIDPKAMNVLVPNLILQPIVENAIKHGISPRLSPGEVEILATRSNGMLKVSIRDDGPGLSKSHRKIDSPRPGLGLSNTRERLIQLYGDRHRFELLNAPEGGLVVIVEIPADRHATQEYVNKTS
jgi:two-component system, LytTR family, sensor kinase